MISQLAQQVVWDYLSRTELRTLLTEGVDETRERISAALTREPQLAELGIVIVAVRVAALRAAAEAEKALEMPTRELIQQEADEATFRRRAEAVENARDPGERAQEPDRARASRAGARRTRGRQPPPRS